MYGGDSYIYLFTIETIGIPKVFLKIAACSFHKFDGIIDIIHIYIYTVYIHAPILHDTYFFVHSPHFWGLELLEGGANLSFSMRGNGGHSRYKSNKMAIIKKPCFWLAHL